MVFCFHGGVQGFVLDGPGPAAHLGDILVVTAFQVKLGGKDGVVDRPRNHGGAEPGRCLNSWE